MEEATPMLDERMSKFFDMIMSSKKDSKATSSKKKKNSLLPRQKWITKIEREPTENKESRKCRTSEVSKEGEEQRISLRQ